MRFQKNKLSSKNKIFRNLMMAAVALMMVSAVVTSRSTSTFEENKKEFDVNRPFEFLNTLNDTPPPVPGNYHDSLQYNFQDIGYDAPMYYPTGGLTLSNPSNIKTDVTYDPKTGKYTVTQKIGDLMYRPPVEMDEEEYRDFVYKQGVKKYWKQRIEADNVNQTKPLIPKLTVSGEWFERIFGSNVVDIRPQGSAELIFGLNQNRTENPALPVKQRKISNFDFNMKVQLNLIGKIGEKLKLTTSYNTEASFDFENQMKLEYTGLEDEIIKKIEAGNVSLPLQGSLITGATSLFGVRTDLQFGKLKQSIIFTQQRGKKSEVTVSGGAQTTNFSVTGDAYEANRHYFLGHYFRDAYESNLSSLPVVNSSVVITKIEVYMTNRTNQTENTRNIVAFSDLGEDSAHVLNEMEPSGSATHPLVDNPGILPSNDANSLYAMLTYQAGSQYIMKDRVFANATNYLSVPQDGFGQKQFSGGREFETVQRARKLSSSEYTLNTRLGYLSLNQSLNYDEVLAVAFQYTYGGQTYQVGEFSDQFPYSDSSLYLKMLKSTQLNTRIPMWDLQMKNVYSIGAYQLNPQDFNLQIYYNNIATGVDIPYIPYGSVNGTPLVQVLNVDRLTVNGDANPDGVFDFVSGVTVNANNGRIYFPVLEPFGDYLKTKFSASDFPTANKYLFRELYDSTKISAQQFPEKNRYKLKGTYKSATGSEITLSATNIPQGAVTVTAGGVKLTENVDYTVDYTLGRVKIINESIMNSGQPIKISLESNSLFNIQQKSLIGTRLDYRFNRDLSIGGTFLRLNERPLTQKVNAGDEPVTNIQWGADANWRTEAPFLTRWIDKLPFISTKEQSNLSMSGEVANLVPGANRAIGKGGNSYIDDFEGSISLIDLRNQGAWSLASIPQNQSDFSEGNYSDTIAPGLNRAKISWYTIDPLFYNKTNDLTPSYYNDNNWFHNNYTRQIIESRLFPNKQPPNGQPVNMPSLDISFYPDERGPYNFDTAPTSVSAGLNTNGKLNDPVSRWGGIMRRLETNDFQAANVEAIQIFLMDPFDQDYTAIHGAPPPSAGDMYIDLGNISEDIIKDGRMSYENGLPPDGVPASAGGSVQTVENNVAVVPFVSPIINAFDVNEDSRPNQDVGFDGMNNDKERDKFQSYYNYVSANVDPNSNLHKEAVVKKDVAGDDYHYYRGDDYDGSQLNTIERYRNFNGTQGNSPTEAQYKDLNSGHYPTTATTIPNIEDVNKDNTMNESESYYQYHVKINPADLNDQNVGNNFIANSFEESYVKPDGTTKKVKWYQIKIPITSFEEKIGSIEGFNSIRFMRVFLKGFDRPVTMRMARFELVRADWRRYLFDLTQPGDYLAANDGDGSFDISAVNIQENGTRTPINYVIPPGINQQQNVQTTNLVLLNEQSLVMRSCNLKDGGARAAYKNVDMDVRSFKRLKMFVHAEPLGGTELLNGDVTAFIRIGTDFNDNFYEYEVPLDVTPPGTYDGNNDGDRSKVWPDNNAMDIEFEKLTSAKQARNDAYYATQTALTVPFTKIDGNRKITIKGSPNLATVKCIMIGIRNPKNGDNETKCVEVWVNELRLAEFNQHGGWAANMRVQAKLADLGTLALAGSVMTPFYGSIEKKVSERSRELTRQYDVSSSLNLGKFFPDKWNIRLPMYGGISETRITPQFNPLDPDILLRPIIGNKDLDKAYRDSLKETTLDVTKRRSINFTNVKKDKGKNATKSHIYDIENFSATYSYSEVFKHNINIEYNMQKTIRTGLTYGFQTQPKNIKFFGKSKSKLLNNKWFALIKEMNFYYMPSQIAFTTDINRNYNEVKNRNITNDAFTQTFFNKTFNFNRTYQLRYDLTKNIKFDFTASNDARVMEPDGRIDTKEERDSIRQNIFSMGTTTGYRHAANMNWTIPINKIPIFDFITATYKYGTTYNWQRRPFAVDTMGNTIQNTNSNTWNAQLNMVGLYNKIPFFKKINQKGSGPPKVSTLKPPVKPNNPKDTAKKEEEKKKDNLLLEYIGRVIMTVKTVSLSYTSTNGSVLPGFDPTSRIMGMDVNNPTFAPGLKFVFGDQGTTQRDIRHDAIENNWLVKRNNMVNNFSKTHSQTFTAKATLEPLPDLKIELNANKTFARNYTSFITYDDLLDTFKLNGTENVNGNFSMSTITFGSAFKRDDKKSYNNVVFDDFRNVQRIKYAELLGRENGNSFYNTTDGQWEGYSKEQQDVLIYAFVAAYTKRGGAGTIRKDLASPDKALLTGSSPLPNWSVKYDGLGKIKKLKKHFKGISLTHTYRSTINMTSFTNNLLFATDANGDVNVKVPGNNKNWAARYTVPTVTISEQFSPLIKVDLQFVKPGWSGNFEIKKDRTLSLATGNQTLNEIKGNEIVVGAGYVIKDLEIKKIKIKNKPLKSDLKLKLDLSVRKNTTIQRRINEGLNTATAGQRIITLRTSAEYQVMQNVSLRFFFDKTMNRPVVSSTFPTSNTNAGVSIRFTLGT
jgi:cell surface protein SprA